LLTQFTRVARRNRHLAGAAMAPLVSKRKTRSQGPPTPPEKAKPAVEEDGPIPQVILAGDESDSDPEISTDGEESGEDDDGASMEEEEEGEDESGSEDVEDGDSEGLVLCVVCSLARLIEFLCAFGARWINWKVLRCVRGEYGSGEEGDESSGDEEEVDEDARNYVLDVMKDFLTGAGGGEGEGEEEREEKGNGASERDDEPVNPTAAEESDSSEDEVWSFSFSLQRSCWQNWKELHGQVLDVSVFGIMLSDAVFYFLDGRIGCSCLR
jgi:hypothetical protein